jgi:hypothetical protein
MPPSWAELAEGRSLLSGGAALDLMLVLDSRRREEHVVNAHPV